MEIVPIYETVKYFGITPTYEYRDKHGCGFPMSLIKLVFSGQFNTFCATYVVWRLGLCQLEFGDLIKIIYKYILRLRHVN